MDKQNKDFDEVLNNAKNLGYAESKPSADLNGDDVSAKLKILTSLCFNSFLNNSIYVFSKFPWIVMFVQKSRFFIQNCFL